MMHFTKFVATLDSSILVNHNFHFSLRSQCDSTIAIKGMYVLASNAFEKTRKGYHLFDSSSGHSLEATLVRLVNLWNLVVVLGKLVLKLGGVQLAVGASSLDDLGLLLECEVLPGELWSYVLLEERKDLIVRNGTWVGEVVDSSLLVLSQEDRRWEEVGKNRVGVWNIDNAIVLGDLGDEVTRVQVIGDWHAKSEDEAVLVVFHDLQNAISFKIFAK
jgi:hypothetical protein